MVQSVEVDLDEEGNVTDDDMTKKLQNNNKQDREKENMTDADFCRTA